MMDKSTQTYYKSRTFRYGKKAYMIQREDNYYRGGNTIRTSWQTNVQTVNKQK